MNTATSWADGIKTLTARGFNQQILEGLGDLGIDGSQYLDAFLAMDQSQIAEFNQKYAQYLKLPDATADEVMMSYAMAGDKGMQAFLQSLAAMTDPGSPQGTALSTIIETLGYNTTVQIESLAELSSSKIIDKLTKALQTKAESKKTTKKAKKAGKTVGKSVVDGAKEGLSEESAKKVVNNWSGTALTELKKVKDKTKKGGGDWAKSLLDGALGALGIASPSKEAIKMIGFFAKGVDVGFDRTSDEVATAAKKSAETILTAMTDSLDSDMSVQPTITPVVDLTEIQNGKNDIYGRLGNMSGSVKIDNAMVNSIGTVRQNNSDIWGAVNELKDAVKQIGNNQGETTINNEFNIENPDPRAVASEVSSILSRQIDRRNREWA